MKELVLHPVIYPKSAFSNVPQKGSAHCVKEEEENKQSILDTPLEDVGALSKGALTPEQNVGQHGQRRVLRVHGDRA